MSVSVHYLHYYRNWHICRVILNFFFPYILFMSSIALVQIINYFQHLTNELMPLLGELVTTFVGLIHILGIQEIHLSKLFSITFKKSTASHARIFCWASCLGGRAVSRMLIFFSSSHLLWKSSIPWVLLAPHSCQPLSRSSPHCLPTRKRKQTGSWRTFFSLWGKGIFHTTKLLQPNTTSGWC